MDGQIHDVDLGRAGSPPMWLKLRVQHGFAGQEERDRLAMLEQSWDGKDHSIYLAGCAPSGCQKSSNTGGCSPGTACLFTCLQSKQSG